MVSRATVSFFKKALLHGAFQIFDDDLHDNVPIFRAAGMKYIISKAKVKRVRIWKDFFFVANAA